MGTPQEIVTKMLDMANINSDDIVCDLGAGDGRLLISSVKEFGAKKAIGYEIRKDLIKIATKEIKQELLEQKIRLVDRNFFDADLSEPSVVIMYLCSDLNELLRPKLEKQLKLKARVVTYLFPIGNWKPAKTMNLENISFREGSFIGNLYLYRIPEAFEGNEKSGRC